MTSPNRELLDRLWDDGAIEIEHAPLFETAPSATPLDRDRVEGMLLGLAIGNALAETTEGLLPEERRRRFGEVRDYLPNPRARNERVGLPMVDTQLAFWTLEETLAEGRFIPGKVAARFARGPMIAMGEALATFVDNFNAGREWYRCGPPSAGNGSLMRIAPIVVPHLRSPSSELWVDATLCALITHNDGASLSSSVAFVQMLWELLRMRAAPDPTWWVRTFIEVARPLEPPGTYKPFNGVYTEFRGRLSRFVEEKVPALMKQDLPVVEACEAWWSGAFLLETVPSVLYILSRHGHDFEEAVVRAVNDTWDNDSIAAIVGAAVGALHGKSAIPERWIEGLVGRTTATDDGRVFGLIAEVSKG
jgi:ADP-ribosyl-[dinitrogen reductase] hydrolase